MIKIWFLRGAFVAAMTMTSGPVFASTSPVEIFQTWTSSVAILPLVPQPPQTFQAGQSPSVGKSVFLVNPDKKFQTMEGFGAALTESCMMNVMKLSPGQRREFLKKAFSKTEGAGFDLLRFPLGSTDFSDPTLPNFTFDDAPGPDPEFRYFDMSRAESSLQLIREAKAINPNLHVIVTPWSAPAWMKTSHALNGGELAPEFAGDFARYFIRVLRELHARRIPVSYLTIQNEPGYATDWYPSMGMSPQDQADFIGNHLGPLLKSEGIPVGILAHDHNWDMSESSVLPILRDSRARSHIAGVAYHCYGGWPGQMWNTISAYPEIPTLQTECTGGLDSVPNGDFHWWMQNQSLSAVNLGTSGAVAWNLCLDQQGGPRNNGCEGCQGLVTIDSSGTELKTKYNPEFFALAQVSRFIHPGSRRIAVYRQQPHDAVHAVAFENADGTLVFVAQNTSFRSQSLQIRLADGTSLDYILPGEAAATFQWKPDHSRVNARKQ